MARPFDVEVRGTGKMLRNLAKLNGRAQVAVEGGLFEAGEVIIGDAKELAPKDLGTLFNSGFTITATMQNLGDDADPSAAARAMARNTARMVTAVAGFGGPSVPYALVQHERTDFRHTVGQALYLETPAQAHADEVPRIVGRRIQHEVNRVAR